MRPEKTLTLANGVTLKLSAWNRCYYPRDRRRKPTVSSNEFVVDVLAGNYSIGNPIMDWRADDRETFDANMQEYYAKLSALGATDTDLQWGKKLIYTLADDLGINLGE